MASFTDQITQFTPYVQQLPVEEMTKVGMYKQAQYDQGVQKIQGYIDNIAGMDVVNDADKAYLQSKLNQLGSRLKTVAAADFSNQQLVNSVGGMATQVIKDPTVQNAVSSTAWYRKQLSDMEKAIQEGKASQANIYDFQKQSNEWLSSGKAGQVFRGRYTPYVDVDKKVLDVIKTLHPGATSEDIAYAKDPVTGQVDYSKIAAAMVRKGYEGVSESQIANAINATLDPNDLNQLRLNANYQFRGYDAGSLQEYAKRKAANQVSSIDSMIQKLEGVAKQYASDPAMFSQAQNSIDSLKKKKNDIELGLPAQLDEIAKNPDALKYKIYKDGFVDTFANAFSWEKNTVELLSNPVLAAEHWEKDYALKVQDNQLQQAKFTWDKWLQGQKLAIDQEMLNLKIEEVRGVGSGFTTFLGENTNIDNPLVAMQKDINGKLQSANNQVKSLATSLYGSASLENIGKAEKAIETYRNAGTEQERNAIPKQWRNIVDQVIADRVSATNLENGLKESERKAMADPSLAGSDAAVKQALEGKTGLTLTVQGKPTYFSKEEIYNYLKKETYKPETRSLVTGPDVGAAKLKLTVDESLLSPKERLLHDVIKGARYAEVPGRPSAAQNVVLDTFKKYGDVIKTGMDFEKRKNDLIAKDIMTKTGKYVPAINTIFVGSDKGSTARTRMEAIATGVLSRYTADKAGAEGLDLDEAKGMLVGDNKGDIQYQKLIQGDKTFLVLNLGNKKQVVPLTDFEAAQLPKDKSERTKVDIDVTTLQTLNGGVTNATGNALNSYFQKVNFPNVKRLNVTADLSADKAAPSVQYMNINLKLPSGWKTLPLDDYPMDANTAASQVGTFTDEKIIQLFLGSRNVPQSWKDEIKNLY